jgi:ribonuclease HI
MLFFDGASKDNPRMVGARGIVVDPRGKNKITYA